jgi:diguanylate cyclase (GGDEF)-like protein/PAS domain S-box-containing protein
MIFLLLSLSLGGLLVYYWSYIMEPRLRQESQVQAKFLAQSQAGILVDALSPKVGKLEPETVIDAMDHILLFSDPVSGSQFFINVALEVDYDVVYVSKGTLDLKRGLSDCNSCFVVDVALYSNQSDELMGVAWFQVSGKFFQRLSDDVRNNLVTESIVSFALLILVWLAVMMLINKLYKQITERKLAEAELGKALREEEAIMASMPDIFYMYDMDGSLVKWNKKMEDITGLSAKELKGKPALSFVPEGEAETIGEAFKEVFAKGINWVEGHMIDKNGNHVPYHFSGVAIKNAEGEFIGLAGMGRDTTESKKAEEALKLLATTDPLTELLNRRSFTELGEKEVSRAKRYSSRLVAMMIDIDHFKKVNDTYGHAVGDEVLKKVTEIFRQAHRNIDILGRLGGEEFGLILPETEIDEATNLAERLREMIERASVFAKSQEVRFTISLGVAALRPEDNSLDDLMKRADEALYKAKDSGRNCVICYGKSK